MSWVIAATASTGIGPQDPVFSWIPAASEGSAALTAASFSASGMNGETTALSYGRCRPLPAESVAHDRISGTVLEQLRSARAPRLDRLGRGRDEPGRGAGPRRPVATRRLGSAGVRELPHPRRGACRLAR